MKALRFDGKKLRLARNLPHPKPSSGEAIVRVRLAGICGTDLEILRGYSSFRGTLGHEFVGDVTQADTGRTVRVVGEINCVCHTCVFCKRGLVRHCARRTVLGIVGRDGAFAEHLRLPTENLRIVPDELRDEAAVFVEPLAAAFEILEQVPLSGDEEVLLLGDGKLAQLIAQVLVARVRHLTVAGHHPAKLRLLSHPKVTPLLASKLATHARFDIVVEATGSRDGFGHATRYVRPRGYLVVKSTVAATVGLDLSPIVVNEIHVLGSRCGPFAPALAALTEESVKTAHLVTAICPLDEFETAFAEARRPSALKVLLRPS